MVEAYGFKIIMINKIILTMRRTRHAISTIRIFSRREEFSHIFFVSNNSYDKPRNGICYELFVTEKNVRQHATSRKTSYGGNCASDPPCRQYDFINHYSFEVICIDHQT